MAKKRRNVHNQRTQAETREIEELAQEYIEVIDDSIKMCEKKRKRMRTEFRKRAKRRKNKLTPKQIELIMSQKGKMSAGQCAEWFYEKMHFHFKITRQTVWWYWNKKAEEKSIDMLDLLDKLEEGGEDIETYIEKIENKEIKVK